VVLNQLQLLRIVKCFDQFSLGKSDKSSRKLESGAYKEIFNNNEPFRAGIISNVGISRISVGYVEAVNFIKH
jgi:hypothetical protein